MTHEEKKSIREGVEKVIENARNAAIESGRNPDDIRIVLATKTQSVERINYAAVCGIKEVGENKVKVIKIVHEATGLGLKEAKEAVDAVENGISYKMIIISGNDKKIFEELLCY